MWSRVQIPAPLEKGGLGFTAARSVSRREVLHSLSCIPNNVIGSISQVSSCFYFSDTDWWIKPDFHRTGTLWLTQLCGACEDVHWENARLMPTCTAKNLTILPERAVLHRMNVGTRKIINTKTNSTRHTGDLWIDLWFRRNFSVWKQTCDQNEPWVWTQLGSSKRLGAEHGHAKGTNWSVSLWQRIKNVSQNSVSVFDTSDVININTTVASLNYY